MISILDDLIKVYEEFVDNDQKQINLSSADDEMLCHKKQILKRDQIILNALKYARFNGYNCGA